MSELPNVRTHSYAPGSSRPLVLSVCVYGGGADRRARTNLHAGVVGCVHPEELAPAVNVLQIEVREQRARARSQQLGEVVHARQRLRQLQPTRIHNQTTEIRVHHVHVQMCQLVDQLQKDLQQKRDHANVIDPLTVPQVNIRC